MISIFDDNESFLDDGNWIPSHRSPIAGHIWRAFAAGQQSGWKAGILSFPAPVVQDFPLMPEFPAYIDADNSGPDWIKSLISALDRALPDLTVIHEALDPDSLTLSSASAAFRMPAEPSTRDAAVCAATARVLLACRDDLISPAFVSDSQAIQWLEYSSRFALMLGGEEAFLIALNLINSPDTFAAVDAPQGNDVIAFGDVEE